MITYVDTSVLIRLVLREAGVLTGLLAADRPVSSELIVVESHRTIDRLRLQGTLTAAEAVDRSGKLKELLEAIDLLLLRPPILSRAADPLPVALGTLDAIHLATALMCRDRLHEPVVMATHDAALAQAARAFGLEVLA